MKIPVADGEHARLPGDAGDRRRAFPVVLVVQEIFGVHEHIQDVCRRLAKLGYLAVAPELYARQGDVSKISDMQEIISKVVSKVPDAQVMADLDATVAWAEKTGEGDAAKLGITGFCWGGRIVWLYAAHSAEAEGRRRLVRPARRPHRPAPSEEPDRRRRRAQGAGPRPLRRRRHRASRWSTSSRCGRRSRRRRAAPEIVVYPDAPHGFFADYRPSYRQEAAKDGWKRLLAWFKKHGVA